MSAKVLIPFTVYVYVLHIVGEVTGLGEIRNLWIQIMRRRKTEFGDNIWEMNPTSVANMESWLEMAVVFENYIIVKFFQVHWFVVKFQR